MDIHRETPCRIFRQSVATSPGDTQQARYTSWNGVHRADEEEACALIARHRPAIRKRILTIATHVLASWGRMASS